MSTREDVVALLRDELSLPEQSESDLRDETLLADMGVNSMDLIKLLVTMQARYGLNLDQMVEMGIPATLGDLVKMLNEARLKT